jgi:DNA-binding LacI/PurR family transcriptional regulator
VGILAPFFTRPAYVARLEGIEAVLTHTQYDLILYNVKSPEQHGDLLRRIIHTKRVDGLIAITVCPTNGDVQQSQRHRMPIVLLDAGHSDLVSIQIDDIDGGRQATQHLVDLGHTRIAYISDPIHSAFKFQASLRRLEGYKQVLAEHGIPFRPEYHRQGEHGRHVAYRLTQELLELDDPPTAIFAASDTQALGVIEAIRQIGMRVPEDVSVVGYDDIEMAAYVGLTTIHQPMYQSGVEAVNALFQLLTLVDGEPPPISTTLPVNLVVRETTAARRG